MTLCNRSVLDEVDGYVGNTKYTQPCLIPNNSILRPSAKRKPFYPHSDPIINTQKQQVKKSCNFSLGSLQIQSTAQNSLWCENKNLAMQNNTHRLNQNLISETST